MLLSIKLETRTHIPILYFNIYHFVFNDIANKQLAIKNAIVTITNVHPNPLF